MADLRVTAYLTSYCKFGRTLIYPTAKAMSSLLDGPDSLMVYRSFVLIFWVVVGDLGKACAI
jgi:hypothetical protein